MAALERRSGSDRWCVQRCVLLSIGAGLGSIPPFCAVRLVLASKWRRKLSQAREP